MKAKDWNIANWIKSKLNIDISDVKYNEHTTLKEAIEKGVVIEPLPNHVVDFIEAKNKKEGKQWNI